MYKQFIQFFCIANVNENIIKFASENRELIFTELFGERDIIKECVLTENRQMSV